MCRAFYNKITSRLFFQCTLVVERKKVHGLTALRVPRTPYLQYHGVRSYLVQGTPLYLLRGTPLYLLRGTPLYLCKDLDRVGLWIVHVA